MSDEKVEGGRDPASEAAQQATGTVVEEDQTFADSMTETEADSAVAQTSAEDLARMLDEVQAKADEHYNQMMRAHADIENLKRRHAQELEKARKFALESFVKELLGVWDSLELGNSAAQDDGADVARLREGTELTLKMLGDVMTKFGVEQISPEGEPFDPEKHQAMSLQPRDDVPPNTVVTVVQKGYVLNGRLMRPAMVMVSQANS